MEPQTHTVRRGENLSIIAKEFSIDVNELAKENGIEKNSILKQNQTLQIPVKKVRATAAAEPDKSDAGGGIFKWVEKVFHPDEDTQGQRLQHDFLTEILGKLRATCANERVHQTEKIAIDKDAKPASYTQKPSKTKASTTKQQRAEVMQQIQQHFGPLPQELKITGVQLTENERMKIIASVATCEMDGNGLSSISEDTEFENGAESVSYRHIVHIGLSYGLIQFTQDGGALGVVLKEMQKKDSTKFTEIFGGGDQKIADSLIKLTNDEGMSGLVYWNTIKGTEDGDKLVALTKSKNGLPIEKEIRGSRVQRLVPKNGAAAIDIWTGVWKERFIAAGKVPAFQEVQFKSAVKEYLRPVLPVAKKLKVRTALALAFLVACKVRRDHMDILEIVAGQLGISTPFVSGADEKKCIDSIAAPYTAMVKEIAKAKEKAKAEAKAKVKEKEKKKSYKFAKVLKYEFVMEAARRAAKLKEDELGFLAEDLYDLATYA
jgi:hypothetical protein